MCVICCFSLAAFNICSLCLVFVNLINMYLGVFHLGFILFGTLWVSWTWVAISFPILGKFSTINLLKYFLMVFLFVFFFWDSYDLNVGAFNIVLEVSEIVLISFNSFFFFPLCFIYSSILSSASLVLSSASVILLLVSSRVLLISVIAFGEGNAPHSSTLAWKIPWTEEPGRLQSMGSLRVGHD